LEKVGFALMRQLINDVEGAPFPNTVSNELYTIWYEHAQSSAQDALEYLDRFDPNNREEVDPDV
jgi:hypothetical protein